MKLICIKLEDFFLYIIWFFLLKSQEFVLMLFLKINQLELESFIINMKWKKNL